MYLLVLTLGILGAPAEHTPGLRPQAAAMAALAVGEPILTLQPLQELMAQAEPVAADLAVGLLQKVEAEWVY